MIWLPRTTDNSTYFAQSLEIRAIGSRLYISRPMSNERISMVEDQGWGGGLCSAITRPSDKSA